MGGFNEAEALGPRMQFDAGVKVLNRSLASMRPRRWGLGCDPVAHAAALPVPVLQ